MDSNPYKSPPPELLAEGISTVMQYVRVRMRRIDHMYNLILERCEGVAESPKRVTFEKCHEHPDWWAKVQRHLVRSCKGSFAHLSIVSGPIEQM